jgi:hypothetical protein
MKNLIVSLILLISITACSQNQKTNNMNEITSNNFVEKVLESVKHYNIEPTYWLNIYKKAEMEIYINDITINRQT